MNNDVKAVLLGGAGFLLFVLLLASIDKLAENSCIKQVRDKPAVEIKLVCN